MFVRDIIDNAHLHSYVSPVKSIQDAYHCCQLILSTRVTSYSTLDKDFIAAQLLKDNYTDKLDADWAAAKHGYFHSSLRFTFRIALVTYIHHHNTIITKHIATQYLSTDNIIRQRKHLRSKLFHTETTIETESVLEK